ncbi:TetR family transcriptional regulator [Actinoplanes rectilineatus]|uniref:TetR family transcriptional regulator n=1 Tax=Actinoplanes rectilineatus TaxID=113571 RepID=UPI0005F2D3AE|nr:TetR family transcriptional regulator [Actinoplanes rectilineatus]
MTSVEERQPAEGLRERKKRLMRRQLSDTAARMFMEHGFDGVRVSEVADACGVSQKTVFNYFPTKEALVMDRLEATASSLRTGLADRSRPPVEAALNILNAELTALTASLSDHDDPAASISDYQRFGELIRATPSLRAYQSEMMDRFIAEAADMLAQRTGMSVEDPEPQIAAAALLGLWRVQFQSLHRHMKPGRAPNDIRENVRADVGRAAQVLNVGLAALES